jgi:hypothetical protein
MLVVMIGPFLHIAGARQGHIIQSRGLNFVKDRTAHQVSLAGLSAGPMYASSSFFWSSKLTSTWVRLYCTYSID